MVVAASEDADVAADILDMEWSTVKRRLSSHIRKLEKPAWAESSPIETGSKIDTDSAPFKMSSAEFVKLRALTQIPPATRNYAEVRSMLHLLRGADLLLDLDDELAASVVAAMRMEEYGKGDVIATERNARDSYLLCIDGALTVLIRDENARSQRSVLFHILGGECFHEEQLIEHAKMAPSLVGGEKAVVLRLGREDFQHAFTSWQLELLERKLALLSSVPCLSSVERRALRPIAERMTQEKVHANTVLIRQGDKAQRLIVIASGACRVLMRTSGGELLEVDKLQGGSICGEIGVLDSVPHTASVVSASDVTLYTIHRSDLVSFSPAILAQLRAQSESYPVRPPARDPSAALPAHPKTRLDLTRQDKTRLD